MLSNLGTLDAVKKISENKDSLENFGLSQSSVSSFRIEFLDTKPIVVSFGSDNPIHTGVYTSIDFISGVYLCGSMVREKFLKNINDVRDYNLLRFDKNKIKSIAINGKGTRLEIVKGEDRWLVKINGTFKDADPDLVDSMLNKLVSLKFYRSVDDSPKTLADYGLLEPEATIILRGGEEEYIIKFGNSTGDNEGVHAVSNLSQVVSLISKENFDYFLKSPWEVRDKYMHRFKAMFIDKVRITKGNETIELVKNLDRVEWNYSKPVEYKADDEIVNDLLYDLQEAKGEKIIDISNGEMEDYKLSPPELEIVLFDSEKGEEYGFNFGKKIEDKFIACMNPNKKEVFLLQAKIIIHIPDDIIVGFRDRRLLKVGTYAANHFLFSWNDNLLECGMNDKGEWQGLAPLTKRMGKDLSRLLSNIDDLEIKDFIDDKPQDLSVYGLQAAGAFIELRDDSEILVKVEIGKERTGADEIFVRVIPEGFIYSVDRDSLEKVQDLAEKVIND